MKKIILAFMAGVIIGWVAGSPSFTRTRDENRSSDTDSATSSQKSPESPAAPSTVTTTHTAPVTLTVPDEQEVGTSVEVTNLETSYSLWAVVYQNEGGVPGRVLGAARFFPGRSEGHIELLRMTLPNLTYFVGLAEDTPSHSFSVHSNLPIRGEDGKQVMVLFTAR